MICAACDCQIRDGEKLHLSMLDLKSSICSRCAKAESFLGLKPRRGCRCTHAQLTKALWKAMYTLEEEERERLEALAIVEAMGTRP